MANNNQIIYVNMNTSGVSTATEELEKELLVLRLAFGKLKASVQRAAAPLGLVFIPAMQKAVWAATRLTNSLGGLLAAFFRQGKAAGYAANKQNALAKANEKVKRSMADFDELDRLETETPETAISSETFAITPEMQAVADKIMAFLSALQTVDLGPAVAAFERLRQAVEPLSKELFSGLEWAWYHLLVPLATWTAEDFLPAFLDTLTASLQLLKETVAVLKPLGKWLWESFLQPLGNWTGGLILQTLVWLKERLEGISEWINKNQGLAERLALFAGAVAVVNGALVGLVAVIGTVAAAIALLVATIFTLSVLTSPILLIIRGIKQLLAALLLLVTCWDKVKLAAKNTWDAICGMWSNLGQWLRNHLLLPVKSVLNGIIGMVNTCIAGMVSAINGIIRAVSDVQSFFFGLLPEIGGKKITVNLKELEAPQIPLLAKGAVLPANKPFMAVLGDQKHGTNIEAPLDTIKQALAEVLAMQEGGGETVVNVTFDGDLAQLARLLKPVIDTETRRRGNSLATGGVF